MNGIRVRDVSVTYRPPGSAAVFALRGVDLEVAPGQAWGVVGESGCGKTTLVRALTGTLPPSAALTGQLELAGIKLGGADDKGWRRAQGRRVALVPQGGMSGLDPVRTVGAQLREQLTSVAGIARAQARDQVGALLEAVQLAGTDQRRYPHELSGGMRQRVVIALALAAEPGVLVVDEPTTGLDGPVGDQLLDLLDAVRRSRPLALVIVSHELQPLVARVDQLAVMYAGRIVEHGPAAPLATRARHPYSIGLIRAAPDLDPSVAWVGIPGRPPDLTVTERGCSFASRCPAVQTRCREESPTLTVHPWGRAACHRVHDELVPGQPTVPASRRSAFGPAVLEMRDVSVGFGSRGRTTWANRDVSLTVHAGQVVGLLGRSGSGKSTLARVALGLLAPDSGSVLLAGHDLGRLRGAALRRARRCAGFVHQDVYGALHPSMAVRALVEEPLRLAKSPAGQRDQRIREALDAAGLEPTPELLTARAAQLSGGQRQRVAIARALAADTRLLVADEPTSMLDAALRAEIATVLRRLADQRDLAILLITHDLGEAAQLCDTTVVLDAGRVVPAARPTIAPAEP